MVIDFNRLCFPQQAIQLLNQTSSFSKAIDVNRMSAWINDLNVAWEMILGSFFLAFFIGYCSPSLSLQASLHALCALLLRRHHLDLHHRVLYSSPHPSNLLQSQIPRIL
jgi:hypothetical protein